MATPMYAIASCLLCVLYCTSSGQASTAIFPQLFLVEGKYQFQGWQYRRLFMPTLNKKTWHEAITMCLQHDALFSHNTTQVGLLSKESTGYLNYLPYMWRYGTKQAHYYPFATNGINSATRGNRHHVACLGKQAVTSCSTDSECPISLGYRCFPAVVPGSIKKCVRTYDTTGYGKSFYRLLTTSDPSPSANQAKATCRSLGMGLPTVQDRAILKSFVSQDKLLIYNGAWLGMNSNGGFIYISRRLDFADLVVHDPDAPLLGDVAHFICTGQCVKQITVKPV
ncbi:uncharacterized protein LOC135810688 [Sycon ciliatum]|uniref:uncharacterized protein LOC135810688 n=1 Tax=Sycon ciliatum TaxID=27933 RepID=UPI0031F6E3D6